MASHTSPDYEHMDGSRIALGYGIDNTSNTSGESGGEVVNSGATVSPRVNSVPVQASQEAYTPAFVRGWRDRKAELHPWRRWANALVYRSLILMAMGLIIMLPLPLIGVPMVILGYAGAIVSLLMYIVYPIVLITWENPNK